MKTKIGFMLFILGWITLDSKYFIVPIAIAALGLWLMKDLITQTTEKEVN